MKNVDEKFMKLAISEAKKAAEKDEVPIGCVIVKDGKVFAKGRNTVEEKRSTLCHAEINAIKKAQKKLGDWRLNDMELYVTIEPCCQCAGAILNARIKRVVYGGKDKVFGGVESTAKILDTESAYWRTEHIGGILEEECVGLLKDFFKKKRNRF